LHEDAHDRPDTDPAEDQNDEPDQAEVALGPAEVVADLAFHARERADACEAAAQLDCQSCE
jgi:hypothetical protein